MSLELAPALFLPLYAVQWVAILFLLALVLGAYNQLGELARQLNPPPTRLRKGDPLPLPLDTGAPLQPLAFVVLMSYGCGPCVSLAKRLEQLDLADWELVTVVAGRPPSSADPELDLRLPSFARHVHDPEREWLPALGARSTPTALAFVDGRLVDQQVGPKDAWFRGVIDKSHARRKEVVRSPVTVG